MADNGSITIKPHAGFQTALVQSCADIVFAAGATGCGKTAGLVIGLAEPFLTDGDFRAVLLRKANKSAKVGGGFIDKFKEVYGASEIDVREGQDPRITFRNGSYADLTYLDDSNVDKMRERVKGWEYDVICIDELTEQSWEAFTYMNTRNRGKSKVMTGRFFATFNPKRTHWSRKFIDWYIGGDGHVIPSRNGVCRFFFVNGDSVDNVVWGMSKEEVYEQCKFSIDRLVKKAGGDFTYKDFIKSFVLYVGNLAENEHTVGGNRGYIGSVAMAGEKLAEAFVGVNFDIDPDEEMRKVIQNDKASACFVNDPRANGDMWITVDLADYGTDNTVALAWNGFHCFDFRTWSSNTPRGNAMSVKGYAQELNIPEDHIIYDATAARYFNDYIPDAIPFISASRSRGMYEYTGATLKDICALRLCRMIQMGEITFDPEMGARIYSHANLKFPVSFKTEFLDECSVVDFTSVPSSGRKRLLPKKVMNEKLGLGRSMDVFDPCNMRMYPCVDIPYGEEFQQGLNERFEAESAYDEMYAGESIYDDSTWA